MTMQLDLLYSLGVMAYSFVVVGAALVAYDNWYYGDDINED